MSAPLSVRYLPLAALKPAPRNARTHSIEVSPAYCDVATLRWQAFVGAEATLEADGRTFAEVAAERTAPATECV